MAILGITNDNRRYVATTSMSMCVFHRRGISIKGDVIDLIVDVVVLLDLSLIPVLSRSDDRDVGDADEGQPLQGKQMKVRVLKGPTRLPSIASHPNVYTSC